jgi:hypothetical protein
MSLEIRKAARFKSKLRLGLAGPSGAGKTMSALKLAHGIAGDKGKIIMIDTERGSGDLYAHLFDYDIITLEPPYTPSRYVEAIQLAESAGADVIILDSLSHAWSDEGGILDQAHKLQARSGNRFTVWADLTPQHRKLVGGMLNSRCHIIATTRSKQDYVVEKDDQNGKSRVKKLGMAPVQRDGMEYEFTIFMDIDQNHVASTSKDRTNLFSNRFFQIDEKIGEEILSWLNTGEIREEAENKKKIWLLLRMLGVKTEGADKRTLNAKVKQLTKLELKPENFAEIVRSLEFTVQEKKDAKVDKPAETEDIDPEVESAMAAAESGMY